MSDSPTPRHSDRGENEPPEVTTPGYEVTEGSSPEVGKTAPESDVSDKSDPEGSERSGESQHPVELPHSVELQHSGEPETPEEPEPPMAASAARTQRTPSELKFRITPISLFAVLTVAICVTPIAWLRPWLFSLYLIPGLLLLWVVRARTVVTSEWLRTRTLLGGASFGWSEVRSLRLNERRWVKAVLASGRQVRLPAVRVRDLPRLSAISGGRLSDPMDSADQSDSSPDSHARPDGDTPTESDSAQDGHSPPNTHA